MVCRALLLKKQMAASKFVVYQDDPAGPTGKQSDIFKRFYWLENEATQNILRKYGIKIEKRSFRELANKAKMLTDSEAQSVIDHWDGKHKSIQGQPLVSAVKLYLAVKADYQKDKDILAMGINCLNESHSCDTTPCLAWNLLYNEKKLVWGCEADIMVMLTELLADKVLNTPFFMTNLYPFIMGKAALAHERIPEFPAVDEPENHILAAHCGYFGLLPEVFSDKWFLRKKVLAMVDENASMIDATMSTGPVTLFKFQPYLNKISLTEAELKAYVQYKDSDCLNGGIIKVSNGQNFVNKVVSHHYVLTRGHQKASLELVSDIFNYELEII
jgi:L-fucose isomerase-like protein